MRKVHLILNGLSLTILLLSLNRLTNFTQGYLSPFEFLRWLDFNAMIPIPLISVLLYYLLKREITRDYQPIKTSLYTFLSLLLIVGIYLFGVGSGDHEVTNYLNFRFCDSGHRQSDICNIISFNDDQFSHYVYYAGFIFMNVALMLLEFKTPRPLSTSIKNLLFVMVNGLVIALGIFANLAFEEALVDLFVFGAVMVLSWTLLMRGGGPKKLPITYYFAVAYTVGVAGTILYKLISGNPF